MPEVFTVLVGQGALRDKTLTIYSSGAVCRSDYRFHSTKDKVALVRKALIGDGFSRWMPAPPPIPGHPGPFNKVRER